MNNFSEEIIEVEGIEYKLFLNRAGIALWEKTTKFSEFAQLLEKKYKGGLDLDSELELNDEFNPNSMLEQFDNVDEDEEKLTKSVIMFYCVALSKNHNLNLAQTKEWFAKAENDYGIEQLTALMVQMIENANVSVTGSNNLKNLKALKSAK